MLVRAVIVEDNVGFLVLGTRPFNLVKKAQEFLMPVALHVLQDNAAVQHIERRKQGGCAVVLVVVGRRLTAAIFSAESGLGPIKSLNLRLLINRKHHGMGRG